METGREKTRAHIEKTSKHHTGEITCTFPPTLGLTIISKSMAFCSCSLLIAAREIHRLLVLKILNFDTDLNSSTCALGTWAISSSRSFPSYWIRVPP